jgi:uncharacterized protein (TIGR03382 family)
MKLRVVAVCMCCLFAPASARADMIGPGEKSVKSSIVVDATVPAGKALVLANTFQGADTVTPGAVAQVSWHPLIGDGLQLRLVDRATADKLAPLREGLDRDKITALLKDAIACGPAFPGVRTISDKSPAEEVRWTFKATVADKACTAELLRTEYLDAGGKVVSPPVPDGDIPPPKPLTTAEPAKAEPAKTEAPKTEAPKAESGCSTTGPAAPAGLVLVGLALLRRRRR